MKATVNISDELVYGLLCCALEGGVGYWCCITDYEYGEGLREADFRKGGKHFNKRWFPLHLALPMHGEGCAVLCIDQIDDDKPLRLDRAAVERGVQIMANKYPKHFADFMQHNEDDIEELLEQLKEGPAHGN